MKKTLLGLALAMAMAAGNAWANEPAAGQHKGHTGTMGQKNEILGTVQSINPAKNQLVLRSEDSPRPTTLLIDKNTEIMVDGQTAALKYAPIAGNVLGASISVQKQINRIFWILPNYEGVLYSITSTSAAANGVYYMKLPPTSGPAPTTDAGVPDAAPDAAAGN